MAVISTVSLGCRRNGRYANRSIKTPSAAQIAMEINNGKAAGNGGQRQNSGDFGREIKPGERAEHEDVAVREIDEPQNAIDHRVAEGDEREDGAEREAVDELLVKNSVTARRVPLNTQPGRI
jgi:hypothetical protein